MAHFYSTNLELKNHRNLLNSFSQESHLIQEDSKQFNKPFWLASLDFQYEKYLSKMMLHKYPPTYCLYCKRMYNANRQLNFHHVFTYHLDIPIDILPTLYENTSTYFNQHQLHIVDLVNWFIFCCYPWCLSLPKPSQQLIQTLLNKHIQYCRQPIFEAIILPNICLIHQTRYLQSSNHIYGPLVYNNHHLIYFLYIDL